MSPLPLPWVFTADEELRPGELQQRLQDVLDTVAQQFPIGAENLQDALRPVAGVVVATGMPALADGGVAAKALTGLPFGGRTPTAVVATLTTGGTIFFSAQSLNGTYSYVADGFSFQVTSNGLAVAAGWSVGVAYAAYF